MLPIFQDPNKNIMLLQNAWAQLLNPVITNVVTQGQLLTGVSLANGSTTFNHLLSRQMQGWFLTDVNGAATIYRSKPFNGQTLTLTSNAAVSVSLWVF